MRFDRIPNSTPPSEQMPKDIESLSETERVARLAHQLGVMYDRVMLTGDWEGEHSGRPETGNVFDDIHYVSSAARLAEGVVSFLAKSEKIVPKAVNPEDISEAHERRDFNRRLFIETLKYTKDILRGENKGLVLELEKAIDENLLYFRDIPFPLPGGHVKFDTRKMKNTDIHVQDERVTDGLKRITDKIVASIDIAQLDEPPSKTI